MPAPVPARTFRPVPRAGALALAVVVGATSLLAAACGEDQTGQPGVADVDFTPRLIVTLDAQGFDTTVGPKGEGDPAVSADPARLPAGSVVELRFGDHPDGIDAGDDDGAEHRVVGHLWAPGEAPDLTDREVATPAPLIDTGPQRPGDTVTVVLSEPGTLELTEHGDDQAALTIEVTPRET